MTSNCKTACSIKIEGLKIYANHGVLKQERTVGNMFEIDATLYFDGSEAMQSDSVEATINYADVIELISKEMKTPSQLLENATYLIYRAISERYPQIGSGTITLYKIHPPLSAEIKRVGFTFSW